MFKWYWRALLFMVCFPFGGVLFFILVAKGLFLRIIWFPAIAGMKTNQKKSGKTEKKLLCLAYMDDTNASARHRLYKYPRYFTTTWFHIVPPTPCRTFRRLYPSWKPRKHLLYFALVFFRRFIAVWSSTGYDAVFVQREIIGEFFFDPPLFIFALKLLNPRIIFDVDDVIWMIPPHSVRAKSRMQNRLADHRFYWNVRLSRHVVVSNEFLKEKVKRVHDRVTVIPTLVDVENYPKAKHEEKKRVVIGWIGGGGNLTYLKCIETVLSRLAEKYAIVLRIISSRSLPLNGVDVEFIPWKKETASLEMSRFDIGVMPLPENAYTKGKGGFKLLEYMAAGLPTVASPVGVNKRIITNGERGFLAGNSSEWESALARLIEDRSLRMKMGNKAREFVFKSYDYHVWVDTFHRVMEKVCR